MLMAEVIDRIRVLLRWVDATQRAHPEQLMNGDERAAYVVLTNEVRTFQHRSSPVFNTPTPDRKQVIDKLTKALKELGLHLNGSPDESNVLTAMSRLEDEVSRCLLARQKAAGPKSAVQQAAEDEFKKSGLGPQQ